ncbi:MAG: head-tail connector protein [Planctomycetota bacterium]
MALTTAANVKEALGISGSDSDALIANLITRATALAERYCDRVFESATYTDEKGDARGTGIILVRNPPITSVTSVAVRSSGSTYTTLAATDYDFTTDDAGRIELVSDWNYWDHGSRYPVGGSFGTGINSYRVTYTGGYLAGTHDSELAALEEIIIEMVAAANPADPSVRAKAGSLASESLGYQNFAYREVRSKFESQRYLLDNFRRLTL